MDEGIYEEHAEGSDTPVEESSDLGDRMRGPVSLAIILLILLLTVCASIGTLTRFQLSRAQFLTRNAECLACHTEVLAQMRLTSQHQPFISEHCTSCHTPHGRWIQVRQRTWFASFYEGVRLWFRWGPFRWLFGGSDSGAGTTSSGASTSGKSASRTTRSGLGPSKLVAVESVLCWSCHPGIAPDRKNSVQHLPFMRSQCTSCHNPHASPTKPLLLGRNDKELCGRCHPMADLARRYLHVPAERWQCRSCHEAHGSNYTGMLFARQKTVCFSCHPSVAQDSLLSVMHKPFNEDECTGCHEPHGADVKVLLIDEQPALCYRCHPQTQPEFAQASHHPVPDKILCTSCHRPHASEFQALLVNEEKRMCLGCHSNIDHLRSKAVQHEPFEKQKCTSCHVPHGSRYRPLLQVSEPTLCYRCHPSIADEFNLKSHHPVGSKLKCTGCHEVHASDNGGLLVAKGNNLCYRCHPKIRTYYEVSLHWTLKCVDCHRWHGSNFSPLLRKLNPPLCLGCHTPNHYYSGPKAHPTWPKYWDWHAKKPLTCTSTCHNPHGTEFKHMIRRYDPDWDGQCKQCHKGVGIWY